MVLCDTLPIFKVTREVPIKHINMYVNMCKKACFEHSNWIEVSISVFYFSCGIQDAG